MGSLKSRVEEWIKDQTQRMGITTWPPPLTLPQPPQQWRWRWPWPPPPPPWARGKSEGSRRRREEERLLREEYERQRQRLADLCRALKVESLDDLQEVLCSMVLAECVYKRPASEMLRFVNRFKSDFGGQVVSLERVQPSLDHVQHRYLLAEAGDTLFVSFIGTKQYKDVIADVNIFQGAIFHEDNVVKVDVIDGIENDQHDGHKNKETVRKPQLQNDSKPAVHRGFFARAKGIPALELYKLALKKKRKLVLCGHSLGGAVAALSTLAILRALASSPVTKQHEEVQVKCITFSQPPVGNAALKEYVDRKGWRHYFKTYCIPEDLVPRILSPAYFHHYNAQAVQTSPGSLDSGTVLVKSEETDQRSSITKLKETDGEQLVLGVGPIQTSIWRLSKLVPLDAVRKHLNIFKGAENGTEQASPIGEHHASLTVDEADAEPQSLEIEEGSEGISLNPLPNKDDIRSAEANGAPLNAKNSGRAGKPKRWHRVPSLPSYVPFGQLYLLGSSSVESLSDAEYSKLTMVSSVISELRERLQSHSMRSYRSRFQRIYDQCMCLSSSAFLGFEQSSQFPQLLKWLGLAAIGAVELGHIVDPPVIHTATSIVPLGWSGIPGDKNCEPLKVDIVGHGLHLCTLVQAQVNGKWCSTVVESSPSMVLHTESHPMQPDLQKMRVLIGSPLKRPPKYPVSEEFLNSMFSSEESESTGSNTDCGIGSLIEEKESCIDGLNGFIIYCTSDFLTVTKKVHVRTRRVRLIGFEDAGKTSLFKAVLNDGVQRNKFESIHPEVDAQEGFVRGVCYVDSAGINMQELQLASTRFREELLAGTTDLSMKTDLVVIVHNLSQKIPRYQPSLSSLPQPALSVFLNEAKALCIPWVLAITNEFSVSAHQQKMMVKYAMEAYGATPTMTEVINSVPFVMPTAADSLQSQSSADDSTTMSRSGWTMLKASLSLIQMPFQRKVRVFPVQGVAAFRQLVHRVLRSQEEIAFKELADERLSIELARGQERAMNAGNKPHGHGGSLTAAAVGASLGAGLGLVMAIVMGAASALRKP